MEHHLLEAGLGGRPTHRICPNAHESGLTKRDDARVADEHVKADHDQHAYEHFGQRYLEAIKAADIRERHDNGQNDDEENWRLMADHEGVHEPSLQTRSMVVRAGRRPAGRISRTRITTTNAKASRNARKSEGR